MIQRSAHLSRLRQLLQAFPVVALIGARQVGKTTLARQLAAAEGEGPVTFFDLEDPRSLAELAQPMLALEKLTGLVVLDEVQHRPELFPVLRVLVDRPEAKCRFLVLGSASPQLLRQSSESLAGRIAQYRLDGLDLSEIDQGNHEELWLRGGFPRSYLAADEAASDRWRLEFMRTYLQRDLPNLGFRVPAPTMEKFWSMLAHYHAQTWNGAELSRALGVSANSVRHYLDILCQTFMARRLEPWFTNIGKRLVKSPKVYLSDPGILHHLLGIHSRRELFRHPKVGASFEGFAISELIQHLRAEEKECFFWGAHSGAELDLLIVRGGKRRGFEIKFTDSPSTSKSMHAAMEGLELETLDVVHAGSRTFPLAKNIRALSLTRLKEDLPPL